MAISVASEQRIELLGTVELLHDHLTTSLCQTVFQQTRTTERERQWSLEALVSFWTEVILRAPQCQIGNNHRSRSTSHRLEIQGD